MKILLVEDEPKTLNALRRGLEQERYVVEAYDNGGDGLGAALGGEYDVMILDRMLPEVEGMEICRRVRAEKIRTPVIMLTAKGQIMDRVEGLDAGADDYLVKPFSFEELLARVRTVLRRPQDVVDNVLMVGDLMLDTASCEVRRAGKKIELTSTEFRLLKYMMRNAGVMLSKDRLIEHVWDFDADILHNTVEAYIGYLRNKIDKPFRKSPQLIKTLRGFGYKLSEG
jgi:DNA-binding response OmpR family regulator